MAAKQKFEGCVQGLVSSPLLLGFAFLSLCSATRAQTPANPRAAAASAPAQDATEPGLPTGKKLMLKDGSFQLVREYEAGRRSGALFQH